MTPTHRLLLLGAVLAAGACTKNPEPDSSSPLRPSPTSAPAGAAASSASPSEATPRRPSDVAWDAPASFVKADNTSPMRKATYHVKAAPGDAEDAELSVSQAGGTVDMNIKRWAGQFELTPGTGAPKSEPRLVGDFKVTVVEMHGTWTGSGMPGSPAGAPKPGYALLGAIVDTATPTFFKLTGPEKTVMAAKTDFDKLVQSLRAK
jgi:hypothetical protein